MTSSPYNLPQTTVIQEVLRLRRSPSKRQMSAQALRRNRIRYPLIEQIRDALIPTEKGQLEEFRRALHLHEPLRRIRKASLTSWDWYERQMKDRPPTRPEDRIQATRIAAACGLRTSADVPEFLAAFPQVQQALDVEQHKFNAGERSSSPRLDDRKSALRAYNSMISQLSTLGEPTVEAVAHGMYLAAQGHSPSALSHYITLASSLRMQPEYLDSIIRSMRQWVSENPFAGWDGLREKQELAALVEPQNTDDPGSSQVVLYTYFGIMSDEAIRDYLYLLAELHGAEAVFKAWQDIQASEMYPTLINSQDQNDIDRMSGLVHDHVKHLAATGEPGLAWRVASSLNWPPSRYRAETWTILLDYPEYITVWHEGMDEIVLKKYEEYAQNLEDTLGVRWTGGEDGQHEHIDEEGYPEQIDASLLVKDTADSA